MSRIKCAAVTPTTSWLKQFQASLWLGQITSLPFLPMRNVFEPCTPLIKPANPQPHRQGVFGGETKANGHVSSSSRMIGEVTANSANSKDKMLGAPLSRGPILALADGAAKGKQRCGPCSSLSLFISSNLSPYNPQIQMRRRICTWAQRGSICHLSRALSASIWRHCS